MKDYIVLKDYEIDTGWQEIFLFDHELTNGEIERINKAIQDVKDADPCGYDNSDIEEAIDKIVPYTDSFILSNEDDYHLIYY